MPGPSDIDLYRRGVETAIASWAAIARGSRELPWSACRASPPQCSRTSRSARSTTTRYSSTASDRPGAPRHRRDGVGVRDRGGHALRGVDPRDRRGHAADLEARRYAIAETTRAMGMALADIRVPRPELDLAPPDWPAYVEYLAGAGVPAGLLQRRRPGRVPPPDRRRRRRARRDGAGVRRRRRHRDLQRLDGRARPAARARHGPDRAARARRARARCAHARRSSRRRWPSASTPRSASATSGGSSSLAPPVTTPGRR